MRQLVNLRKKNYDLQILSYFKSYNLLLITKLHNTIIDLLYKIQKNFIWQEEKAKTKYSTLCNNHEKGGIKKC